MNVCLKDKLMEKYGKLKLMEYKYIDTDKLFLQNGINIIYGEKFQGKTVSTLMYLQQEGIEPMLIDFDRNPKYKNLNYVHLVGSSDMVKDIIEHEAVDNEEPPVIVVDTLDGLVHGKYMTEEDASKVVVVLKELAKVSTVILLAHATIQRTAVRKSVHFRGNEKIVNSADTVYKLMDTTLFVEKNRGYEGDLEIAEWMR